MINIEKIKKLKKHNVSGRKILFKSPNMAYISYQNTGFPAYDGNNNAGIMVHCKLVFGLAARPITIHSRNKMVVSDKDILDYKVKVLKILGDV